VALAVLALAYASKAGAVKSWTSMLTETQMLADGAVFKWGYDKKNGPSTWASQFSDCGKSQQSPIDIKTLKVDESQHKQPLQPQFTPAKAKALQVLNNGHIVQVQGSDKFDNNGLAHSSTLLNGERYHLLSVNFHGGSEHRINGKQFPLEAQFVHKSKKGRILVLAVLFTEGKTDNAVIKAINWAKLKNPSKVTVPSAVGVNELLPPTLDYYFYHGSYTTPPCTEGVDWVVLKAHQSLSKKQIASFPIKKNFRPPQALSGRKVFRGATGTSLARRMGYINPDDPNGYGKEAINPMDSDTLATAVSTGPW
jgi:carbonic anhydrase